MTKHLAYSTLFWAASALCLAACLFYVRDGQNQLSSSSTLTGIFVHDFGVVEISVDTTTLSHVFELKNTSRRAIHIQSVSSSCGCIAAVADRDSVNPGELIFIEASLTVTNSGQRNATIFLATDHPEAPLIQLHLQAQGRRIQTLSTLTQRVNIKQGSTASITLYLMDYETHKVQPAPSFDHESELNCAFTGWKLMAPGSPESGIPSRWHGDIQISLNALTTELNNSSLSAMMPNGAQVVIQVTTAP